MAAAAAMATAAVPKFTIIIGGSFGAGNYKYAFGLGSLKLTKDVQKIRDSNCNQVEFSDPRVGETGYVAKTQNIDCEIGANADGILGAYNEIENERKIVKIL